MKEVNPKETTRAYAFEMWMNAPMPMLTFFKTIDVTRLARISKRTGLKFNMLMCWCIGRAASGIKEFHMLPVGRKLIQYDSIAVNTIVANREGEVSSCDVPFSDNLQQFNADYLRLTKQVAESCRNHDLTDSMVIGTSALAQYEIDGAVGTAVGENPVALLIPCHRVIRSTGELGNYHWGDVRKTAIIGWEAARKEQYRINSNSVQTN